MFCLAKLLFSDGFLSAYHSIYAKLARLLHYSPHFHRNLERCTKGIASGESIRAFFAVLIWRFMLDHHDSSPVSNRYLTCGFDDGLEDSKSSKPPTIGRHGWY